MTNAQESYKQALRYRKVYAVIKAIFPELDIEQVKVQGLTALTDIDLYVTIGETIFPIAIPEEYKEAVKLLLAVDGYTVTVVENGIAVDLTKTSTLVNDDNEIDWSVFEETFGKSEEAKKVFDTTN